MLSSAQMPPKVAAEQRVGIAQALLGNPEIVILDEPTVGLDPKQSIEIRTLIRDLAKEHTVILSSHILAGFSLSTTGRWWPRAEVCCEA